MELKRLPDTAELGYVHLTIADLQRSLAYYQGRIGLELLAQNGGEASLGAGGKELLRLTEVPGAQHMPRHTGLYHFALLVPSRPALAQVLHNLMVTNTQMTGAADHLVSEALYLDDPDGNGIEIYRDRPRSEWTLRNGRPQMDTLPLDFEGILGEAEQGEPTFAPLPPDTVLGHMHLHVADLGQSITFYREVIGFDLQLRWGRSAAFLAAGGYHHHLGINTWAGEGVPPPPEGSAGLRYYVLMLPDLASFNDLLVRLDAARVVYDAGSSGLFVRDPSQNGLLVRHGDSL